MKKTKQLFHLLLISISICLLIQSCDKNDIDEPEVPIVDPKEETDKPIESPEKIEIISGNNQLGYKGRLLPDAIYIEIIPKTQKDVEYYYYQFDSWNARVAEVEKKADRIILKVLWELKSDNVNQKTTMSLYSTLNREENGANKSIATIEIKASVKTPWKLIFTDTGNIIGPGDFFDIHFSDDKNGIVIGDYFNGNAKTTDGGNTWNFARKFRSDLFSFTFYDNLNGFVEVTNNWAFFTNDGGNTFFKGDWTPPMVGHRVSNDFLMIDKNTIFSVGNKGTIVKSIDSGKTWETIEITVKHSIIDIYFFNRNLGYIVTESGEIAKSTDGGKTWQLENIDYYGIDSYYGLTKVYFKDTKTLFGIKGHSILKYEL